MSLNENPSGENPSGIAEKNLRQSGVWPDLSFKLLIVEDDLCLKSSISRVLNSISCDLNLKWVTTAKDGVNSLQNEPFDFIIADYLLPDFENGLWIWDKCKRNFPEMPFLLMSGIPVESFLDLTAGRKICPSFLPKPFWPQELRENVISMLGEVLDLRKKQTGIAK